MTGDLQIYLDWLPTLFPRHLILYLHDHGWVHLKADDAPPLENIEVLANAALRLNPFNRLGEHLSSESVISRMMDVDEVGMLMLRYRSLGSVAAEGQSVIAICHSIQPFDPSQARALAACTHLSRRESETAIQIANGRSLTEVSASLGISISTARNHLKSAMQKLDIHTQRDLSTSIHRWFS